MNTWMLAHLQVARACNREGWSNNALPTFPSAAPRIASTPARNDQEEDVTTAALTAAAAAAALHGAQQTTASASDTHGTCQAGFCRTACKPSTRDALRPRLGDSEGGGRGDAARRNPAPLPHPIKEQRPSSWQRRKAAKQRVAQDQLLQQQQQQQQKEQDAEQIQQQEDAQEQSGRAFSPQQQQRLSLQVQPRQRSLQPQQQLCFPLGTESDLEMEDQPATQVPVRL